MTTIIRAVDPSHVTGAARHTTHARARASVQTETSTEVLTRTSRLQKTGPASAHPGTRTDAATQAWRLAHRCGETTQRVEGDLCPNTSRLMQRVRTSNTHLLKKLTVTHLAHRLLAHKTHLDEDGSPAARFPTNISVSTSHF